MEPSRLCDLTEQMARPASQGTCTPKTSKLVNTVARSKSKNILVKMLSQAGTGYTFNTKRSRLREKLTLLRYDPVVQKKVLFVEQKKIRSI
ncbi:39S ribosomal protein L33, mitochondrial isoform X1 [Echinops telfairi]|uniref:39S ribosomal protein L33, mitochondrial isoform X1 n=1 Tax=Echinops telfairi TaxID=9371 RepID=A0AC55CU34_ECHTE|nr:39S ribosomal protein L33, mitochondrial isoform X1 [Echinops telfairi]